MLRFFAAFAILFVFSNQKLSACGYNFIGDCSSGISLKINGTTDSFAVAPCPDVLKFNGFALGSLQSLSIARARAATWESCQNNVSAVKLYYRVFEQGMPGGSWQNLDLQEDYNTLVGAYTTRYRSKNANINLTSGLTVGKTYVLEIYLRAEVDTIGDDFIPETFMLQNNTGQNYHLTFQYGGPSAPPFVVATTKVVNVKCHGDSTGVAGVTVYGNPTGLFYQWSTGGNNYPILSHIPVGTYSVTVTGVGGYAASDTIDVAQPAAPLSAQFMVVGLGCGGAPGQATAFPAGGTAPYHYVWENGGQDSAATFAVIGDYALTLTDANGCSVILSVIIPAQPIVTVSIAAKICEGETYTTGGLNFSEQGNFEISLTGAGGACDTLIQLTLIVVPNPIVWLEFEIVEPVACSALDPTHVIIKAFTSAQEPSFEWVYNGQIISAADTCFFTLPGAGMGLPTIPDLTVTDKYGCSTEMEGITVAVQQPLPLVVEPIVVNPTGNLENGAIHLTISGGVPGYSILWDNGLTTYALTNIGPGTYCATVTDAHGCTAAVCATLETSSAAEPNLENLLKIAPNPAVPGQQVEITFPDNLAGQEVQLEILDWLGQALMRQKIQLPQTSARLSLPEELPPGTALIRATGANGKSAIGKLSVR